MVNEYRVLGKGFNLIQAGSLGVYALDNENPKQYLDTNNNNYLFNFIYVSQTEAILRAKTPMAHGSDNYLGCIVSSDRQTTYWTNETRPLPSENETRPLAKGKRKRSNE